MGLVPLSVKIATAAAVPALAIVAAHARDAAAPAPESTPPVAAAAAEWRDFAASFRDPTAARARAPAPPPAAPAAEIDVVDAHWMALTMWGEARAEGEAGLRAVGHVIDNRRRAGMHGRYATDQVGEAFQFSCWNPGDPNRAAMLDVDRLDPAGEDARTWRLARRLAGEIMAGRSADPTGGALYYHSVAVAPVWSRGVAPAARIGSHLFFRAAR